MKFYDKYYKKEIDDAIKYFRDNPQKYLKQYLTNVFHYNFMLSIPILTVIALLCANDPRWDVWSVVSVCLFVQLNVELYRQNLVTCK